MSVQYQASKHYQAQSSNQTSKHTQSSTQSSTHTIKQPQSSIYTESILHYATLIDSPFFTYNMHFYGVYWFFDFCLVLGLYSNYYIVYRIFVWITIFWKYGGKVCWWVLWVVERLTTIVGTIVGALVGVDSGTMLASCSGVAEFPLYPCTQTTYSLPPSVCSCAY